MIAQSFSHTDPSNKSQSEKLFSVLESCSGWPTDNKLSLHLRNKLYVVWLNRNSKNAKQFSARCKGYTIQPTIQVKYLRLKIDNTLSCKNIVNDIVF